VAQPKKSNQSLTFLKNKWGLILWILWAIFLVYSQFKDAATLTLQTKIINSLTAVLLLAFLPRLFIRRRQAKKAEKKRVKEARLKQGLPEKEPLTFETKTIRIMQVIYLVLGAYALYLVFTDFVPALGKFVTTIDLPFKDGPPTDAALTADFDVAIPAAAKFTYHYFLSHQIGKVFLILFILAFLVRIFVRFKNRSKRS
jgi:hypothetical protein